MRLQMSFQIAIRVETLITVRALKRAPVAEMAPFVLPSTVGNGKGLLAQSTFQRVVGAYIPLSFAYFEWGLAIETRSGYATIRHMHFSLIALGTEQHVVLAFQINRNIIGLNLGCHRRKIL